MLGNRVDRGRAVWRHPLHANIPHFFYSMMKTHQKIAKIFSFTLPFADRSCVPDASSRCLQATSITGQALAPLFHSSLAARGIFLAPVFLQKDKDHRRPTTTS